MTTFRQDTKIGGMVPMMKTDDINDQAITKDKIRDGNVTAEKLADGAVSTDKLPDGSIKTSKIADGNITTSKLAEASVVTSKIADQNITKEKIADQSVDNSKLSPEAVTYDKLKDKSVITEKLNDRAVTTEKVEEKAITNTKLSDQSVDGRVVREASIEGKHIGNNAVSTSKIAPRSITTDKLAQDSISRAKLTPDVRMSIDKKADAEQVNNSLYNLEKKIGDRFVVEGDVTNLPDEEDLTSVKESDRDVLKLADRSYAPEKFSGKGYKILRRNIKQVSIAVTKIQIESSPSADGTLSFTINGKETQVAVSATTDNTTTLVAQKVASVFQESIIEYEVLVDTSLITLTRKPGGSVIPSVFSASTTGVVCTVMDSTKREFHNILTPDMINQPNTIYEIRYDYDLHNVTINLPQNCILKFCGGSLNNGKLNGNNSIIEASPVRIFGKDIEISGTFVNSMNYAEWFDLNYEKTLLSFYGIDFIGNYLISKKISVDTGTHRIYLRFHPQSKITVNSTFIGDYLFDIKNSNLSDSSIRSDYNGVSGQGEIDLSERCGLISFTASNKISNLVAKGTNFFNLTNVYHAGKSIDTIAPTYDSNTVINTAIIKVEYGSTFTNVKLCASRNSSANKPDCGIFLQGTDHKLNRITIVINTIGIYGVRGSTYIQDCHIWGAPNIAFYITGNHTINNTFGDWAICSFYFKTINVAANITNHFIIGSTDKNTPWYQGENMSIIKSTNPNSLSGQVSYFYANAYKAKLCVNDNNEEVKSNIRFQYIPKVNDDFEKLKLSHVFINPDYTKDEFYIAIECNKFYTSNLTISLITASCSFDEFRLGKLPTDDSYYCLAHINKNKYNTLGIFNIISYINKEFNKIIIKVISKYTQICISTIPEVDIKSYNITKDIYDSYVNNSSDFINLPCIPLESKVSRLPEINRNIDIPCFIYDINAYCTIHYPDKKLNSIIPRISGNIDNDIFNIGFVAQKDREIVMWNGTNWVNLDGYSNDYLRKGTTNNRPSLKSEDEGFEYYDTTIKKKILWNGSAWVNMDGTELTATNSNDQGAENPS